MPPTLEHLLSNNEKYTAKGYTASHTVADFTTGELKGQFPSIIIISCCDPRLIPEEFGLFSREEYIVVRNAGGRAEPAIRDICVLEAMTKLTDLVVIHHTDCGLSHLTSPYIRTTLKEQGLGDEKLERFDFKEIKDMEQSVKDDVEFLKNHPYVHKDIKVTGYVFDILKTGKMHPVA